MKVMVVTRRTQFSIASSHGCNSIASFVSVIFNSLIVISSFARARRHHADVSKMNLLFLL